MEVNYETEKKVIESLIFSFKKPISIYQIKKEYEQHCGKPIPYLQLGFTSLENFILSLGEKISTRYSCDGILLLSGKTTHATEHVKKLINGQKNSSKVTETVKRNYSSGYNYSSKYNSFQGSENRFCNKIGRTALNFQIQQRIKALLYFHPEGVSAEDLQRLYYEEYQCYKNDLNFLSNGYDSLGELLSSCSPDVLNFEGPLRNRMFYPKIRLDNSQLTDTLKASVNEVSGNFSEVVEKNCVKDECYVTFQMDNFKNILTFPIEVGEVYSPVAFHVLNKSFISKLDELTLEMENYYLKNGNMNKWAIKTPDILFAQPVAVYYKEENTFYRGTIIAITGIDNVQVYLADYGTNAQVTNSHLLYLHKKFFDLPAQAINAKLHNVELLSNLRTGVDKASYKFLELVSRLEPLTAKIYDIDVKNYSLSIEIYGSDGTSINEILVNEGYCRHSSSSKYQPVGKSLDQDSKFEEEAKGEINNSFVLENFGEKKCSPAFIDLEVSSSSIGKLSPVCTLDDNRDMRSCSHTNSFRNSGTSDTGFLSSSDENIFTATGPTSQNDLLYKSLMSLESARTFIKHKRRQIYSRLSEDPSLANIYVSLSSIKANIVALETELKVIIRKS